MIAKSRAKSGDGVMGQASLLRRRKCRKFNELAAGSEPRSKDKYRIMYIMGNHQSDRRAIHRVSQRLNDCTCVFWKARINQPSSNRTSTKVCLDSLRPIFAVWTNATAPPSNTSMLSISADKRLPLSTLRNSAL